MGSRLLTKSLEPQSRRNIAERRRTFSLGEACWYLLGWAVCFGIWLLDEPHFLIALLSVSCPAHLSSLHSDCCWEEGKGLFPVLCWERHSHSLLRVPTLHIWSSSLDLSAKRVTLII